MMPRRTLEDVKVEDVEKRRSPSKHYVYIISVSWSDGSSQAIFRRYSKFFDLQMQLLDKFPVEGGQRDPKLRTIPFLPGKILFRRSHIRDVAVKRLKPINEYCRALVRLPAHISQCPDVLNFFETKPEDLNPQRGENDKKRNSQDGDTEGDADDMCVAVADYERQQGGEISLRAGQPVEVIEKSETGWWFVSSSDEQGWVPASFLEPQKETQDEIVANGGSKTGEVAKRRKPHLKRLDRRWTLGGFTNRHQSREERCLAVQSYTAQDKDEISFEKGATLDVLQQDTEGWWLVRHQGRQGWAPASCLQKVPEEPATRRKTTFHPVEIISTMMEVSNLPGRQASPGKEPPPAKEGSPKPTPAPKPTAKCAEPAGCGTEKRAPGSPAVARIAPQRPATGSPELYKSVSPKRDASLVSVDLQARGLQLPKPPAPPPVEMEYYTIAEFQTTIADGISFRAGQRVEVIEKCPSGWWYVQIGRDEGWAPASFVEKRKKTNLVRRNSNIARPKVPPPAPPAQSRGSSGSDERRNSEVDGRSGASSSVGGASSESNDSDSHIYDVPAVEEASAHYENVELSPRGSPAQYRAVRAKGDRASPGAQPSPVKSSWARPGDASQNSPLGSKYASAVSTSPGSLTKRLSFLTSASGSRDDPKAATVTVSPSVVPPSCHGTPKSPLVILPKSSAAATAAASPKAQKVTARPRLGKDDSSEESSGGALDAAPGLASVCRVDSLEESSSDNERRDVSSPAKPAVRPKPATPSPSKGFPGKVEMLGLRNRLKPVHQSSSDGTDIPPDRREDRPSNGSRPAAASDCHRGVRRVASAEAQLPNGAAAAAAGSRRHGGPELRRADACGGGPKPSNHTGSEILTKSELGAGAGEVYRTIARFESVQRSQVGFEIGEEAEVIEKRDEGWWFVRLRGEDGWVPSTYLEPVEQGDRDALFEGAARGMAASGDGARGAKLANNGVPPKRPPPPKRPSVGTGKPMAAVNASVQPQTTPVKLSNGSLQSGHLGSAASQQQQQQGRGDAKRSANGREGGGRQAAAASVKRNESFQAGSTSRPSVQVRRNVSFNGPKPWGGAGKAEQLATSNAAAVAAAAAAAAAAGGGAARPSWGRAKSEAGAAGGKRPAARAMAISISRPVGRPEEVFVAIADYAGDEETMGLLEGSSLEVIERNPNGWWYCKVLEGDEEREGWVPSNYLERKS
ncbi:SH3 and PX domain-containing protein 2A isoform X1 [Lampetra fluviatilis]